MSRLWKVAGAAMLVGLVALVSVGAVFAQGQEQGKPSNGEGQGFKRQVDRPEDGYGFFAVDQEALHAALADALGISQETLEVALEQGDTLYTLAETYGVDFERLVAVMDAAHAQALADAVATGDLTQAQADRMLERGEAGNVGQRSAGRTADMRGKGIDRAPGTGECLNE